MKVDPQDLAAGDVVVVVTNPDGQSSNSATLKVT